MCEKCRSSHLQSEGASKKFEDLGGSKIVRLGGYQFFFLGGGYFCRGVRWGSTPLHAMDKLGIYAQTFSELGLGLRLTLI